MAGQSLEDFVCAALQRLRGELPRREAALRADCAAWLGACRAMRAAGAQPVAKDTPGGAWVWSQWRQGHAARRTARERTARDAHNFVPRQKHFAGVGAAAPRAARDPSANATRKALHAHALAEGRAVFGGTVHRELQGRGGMWPRFAQIAPLSPARALRRPCARAGAPA